MIAATAQTQVEIKIPFAVWSLSVLMKIVNTIALASKEKVTILVKILFCTANDFIKSIKGYTLNFHK